MKHFIALALISCTVADVLPTLRPGAQWTLHGDLYSGLEWLDKTQTAPTQKDVDAAIATCETAPILLPIDQRITNLEAAVNELSQFTNVAVSLPTTVTTTATQ